MTECFRTATSRFHHPWCAKFLFTGRRERACLNASVLCSHDNLVGCLGRADLSTFVDFTAVYVSLGTIVVYLILSFLFFRVSKAAPLSCSLHDEVVTPRQRCCWTHTYRWRCTDRHIWPRMIKTNNLRRCLNVCTGATETGVPSIPWCSCSRPSQQWVMATIHLWSALIHRVSTRQSSR